MNGTFTGTGAMLRLFLRRDRWFLPGIIVFPGLVQLVFVAAFTAAAPTAEARQAYAETSLHNAAFSVTYGVLRGSSLGELVTWRAGFLPVVVAVLVLLLIMRHTRSEEAAGRRELVAATRVGRHAALAAAMIEYGAVSLLLGLGSTLALALAGLPVAGSLAYGLGLGLVGCTFAAIGGLVAQLTTEAGTARLIGVMIISAAFLIRGVGDVSAQTGGGFGWLSWASPISWAGQLHPFSGERWWVAAVVAVIIGLVVAGSLWVSGRRDLGSGVVRPRPGPATAAGSLASPFALALRLHRGGLASWAAGFALVGLLTGVVGLSISELLDRTEAGRQAVARIGGPGNVIDQYVVGMMMMAGVVGACSAVNAVLRLRVEERDGRAELLLAGPVDRLRWATGHLLLALVNGTVGIVAGGLFHGLGLGLITGNLGADLARVLPGALVYLPLVWLFTAIAFALFGWRPRLAAITYALAAVSLFFGWITGELAPGHWVARLSVFEYVPELPGGTFTPLPLLIMVGASLVLIMTGLAALRRRDLPVG
ncbi:ABC transporter permease [Microlunatus sp. GCM10028923]|uniref:ABC transporter permease n=1 Tax=Microlunatus sp. GCM10028923 TaxID=3273400 RepID=UPI00361CC56A